MSTLLPENNLVFSATDMFDQPVALPAPIECEIVKSFDSPAFSFEGVFPCNRAYPELFTVKVLAGSRVLFEGRLDEQAVSENDQGRSLKLLARSQGAVLLDNEAIPREYRNVTISDMFQFHAYPHGFRNFVCNEDAFFNHFLVEKGMSEWEVLSRFYHSTMKGYMMVDEAGRIICQRDWVPNETHCFSNSTSGALRYSAFQIVNNRYAPISTYLIRNNETNLYSYVYNNPATNLRISRRRCLIPGMEFSVSPEAGQIDALLRVHQSMLGKFVVNVTTPGLLDARVTDRADLNTGYEAYSALFVHQVRHRLGASGCSTTLTLLDYNYI